ncbi:MAG: Hsp33 family molecular chaperone HslO [Rhodospirillaceae bacterium]|nr:Hsp33 family molecular chaperone HslO [Rhodospirillaceae bacterium]
MPHPDDDTAQPFQIEASGLRGRLVRLGPALDTILATHAYPAPVTHALGEMVVVSAVLSSLLKYDGIFTLQTSSQGPVRTLMADVTSDGALRGFARFDAEALPEDDWVPLDALLGRGHLAFTVDQGAHTERYQGIVELKGRTVAECLQHYFRQSEQIDVGLKSALMETPEGWRGGGLLVQRLPEAVADLPSDHEDDWRRAMVLMESCTDGELVGPDVPINDLLFRLFHEDGVRVFTPSSLRQRCRCSRERVEMILRSLDPAEVEDHKIDGVVTMTCEFCNTTYAFDAADLARLLADA